MRGQYQRGGGGLRCRYRALGRRPHLDRLRSGGRGGGEPETIRIALGELEGKGQHHQRQLPRCRSAPQSGSRAQWRSWRLQSVSAARSEGDPPGVHPGRVSRGTPEAHSLGPPRPNLHRVKALRWPAQPCVSTGVGPRAPHGRRARVMCVTHRRGETRRSPDEQLWESTVSRPVGGILSRSQRSLGGHPSERPTWGTLPLGRRASSPFPTLGLAPGGVYRAGGVTPAAGALLPHPFTLTCADPEARHRRFPFCGTVLRVAPTGR
jgi:hypothetical protein